MKDICFLLIQYNKIIDYATFFRWLTPASINEYTGWKIAAGGTNEFGAREVVSVIAEIHPLNTAAVSWRISSESDGYARLISPGLSPWFIIKSRLTTLAHNKRFDDLANLPACVVLMADRVLSAST